MTTYLSLATIASISVVVGVSVGMRGAGCAASVAIATLACWALS